MGAMRTQNPRMTPKVHMLIHYVPEYVRRTAAPLGPTSEQTLESQQRAKKSNSSVKFTVP